MPVTKTGHHNTGNQEHKTTKVGSHATNGSVRPQHKIDPDKMKQPAVPAAKKK